MEPGDELVTPWPSYPLYPIMARRARGTFVPVHGFTVDAILARRQRAHAPRRPLQPERPDRRAAARRRAAPAARGAARARRGAARRGAARLRRRRGARRRARAARGPPAPDRLPQLLQGLGPGGAALRLRDRRPGRRAADRRARPAARHQRAGPGRRARGAAPRRPRRSSGARGGSRPSASRLLERAARAPASRSCPHRPTSCGSRRRRWTAPSWPRASGASA